MKIGRFAAIVAILVGFLAGSIEAQGFKWWQADKFKAEFALTPEQVSRLETTFQDLRPRMTAEMKELERLEDALSKTIGAGSASEAEVMKQADGVEAARSTLGKTRTLMIYRMRLVLTPEQRVKMNALHEKWEAERRKGHRED
jgi:Spy/CpxP family protein refolding chaperone